MGVLSALEPNSVFHFFEEICRIPHGSGNVDAISDFLVQFAKERKLEVYQDDLKNVIIIKEASAGYEAEEPVILQGHMDMVTVKKPDCTKDMRKEGLDLKIDGDLVYAEGTSLGGDDGIAVAYALAALDDDKLLHPRLEVVITVDEEVGMDGARGIDLSMLKGRKLLNIDSEEEGIFTVGCAGGARVDLVLENSGEEVSSQSVELKVSGLMGGHSGVEIHKEGGNSNQLMGRILELLTAEFPIRLAEINGGVADNAIPRETSARIVPASADYQKLCTRLERIRADIQAELTTRDPGFDLSWSLMREEKLQVMGEKETRQLTLMLAALPNGVQTMSHDVPGLVETSLNLGILKTDITDEKMIAAAGFSVRSSVESEKEELVRKLCAIGALAGAKCSIRGDYPGWKYRVDSPLRDKMVALYQKMYGASPEIVAIHAGLECGLLMGKLPDLDCVSFGPEMKNIHTTEETLSISSAKRVWEYLVEFLRAK